ncbi:SAYSvFN domain-containing protein 1 [Lissotriton helveticus]
MERRLAEFRAAQRRANPGGDRAAEPYSAMGVPRGESRGPGPPLEPEERGEPLRPEMAPLLPGSSFEDGSCPQQSKSLLTKTLFLKFLLWLVLLGLFVELEFGLVYFVLSMFYWIYEGMRGPGEKKAGEKSAYSVFNPGCESIQGTLTAEQLERELQYRPLIGF